MQGQGSERRPRTAARARRAAALLALALLGCAPGGGGAPAALGAEGPGDRPPPSPAHPGLLFRAADVPALRARAAESPWRELARAALRMAQDEEFDPSASVFDAKTRMTDLCGALGLACLLDPRRARVDKLVATLERWPEYYLGVAPPGEGVLVRWQQAAMFQSILALDVAHDWLDPLERARVEGWLDPLIRGWWQHLDQDGTESTPGVVALWALYQGDAALADAAAKLYLERLAANLAPSGVYDSGPGYAWARQGGDRLAKYAPVDVLAFTGFDPGLYAEPRLVGLHEWMMRGAYTPRRRNLTFGDSDPSRPLEGLLGYLQPYRAGRFSAAAGRNAAWLVRDVEPRPLLATYVLMEATLRSPEPPTSALWGDCAAFWEAGAGVDSLMGALWSPRTSGAHSHRDVNAVHLYAYGENVLRNSGYCGSGVGVDATFGWDWISDATAANNTLTLDGAEHDAKSGGGIVEGLTAPRFDYAAGLSGPALEAGVHVRSLLMIHNEGGSPSPERPGYFVLFDEVESAAPGAAIDVRLHPDSSAAAVLAPRREVEWTLQRAGGAPVELAIFLATRPDAAALEDGGLCAFDGNEHVGKALRSTYSADASGARNAVTLLVPHDADHAKPQLARASGPGFTGAILTYPGGVSDFVLEARGDVPVALGSASFQARATHSRAGPGGVRQYFVRRGRSFDDGATPRTGFDSDAEVSLFVRATEVHATSAGATVVFHEPLLAGRPFGSAAGTVLSAGPGFVVFALAPGTHAFDLLTGAPPPRERARGDEDP
jgi:hypothetical protein